MTNNAQGSEHFILFTVAGTVYAVASRDVRHMEMVESVTRVPNAPAFVDGVVFSRGQVVPVVNLRARFGFDRTPYDLKSRLVVVQAGTRTIALAVDAAREFARIAADSIQPPQQSLAGTSGRYLDGIATVGDRMVLILNIEEVVKFGSEFPVDAPSAAGAASA